MKGAVERLRSPEERARFAVTVLVSGWCGARGKRLLPSLVLALLAGEVARHAMRAAGDLRTIAEAVSSESGPVHPE